MQNADEKRLLAKIAHLYYEQHMTQNEISKEVNIYRTTVGRLLKKARETGIVEISINNGNTQLFELERYLKELFRLKDITIVETDSSMSEQDKKKAVARSGAHLLKRVIQRNDIVGVAWGSTLAQMIGEMQINQKVESRFVPLIGGPSPLNNRYHVNAIVYDLANQFGGTSSFINAAAILEKKETRNDIIHSRYFRQMNDFWNHLSIAIVGIGVPTKDLQGSWNGLLTKEDVGSLQAEGAVGEICCNFFQEDGTIIKDELNERTVAVDIEKLKNTRYTIALAESVAKAEGILGALRSGCINTLITTDETVCKIMGLIGDTGQFKYIKEGVGR